MKSYWLRQHADKRNHFVYPFGRVRVCEIKDWDDESYLAKSVCRQAVAENVHKTVDCPLCKYRLVPPSDRPLERLQVYQPYTQRKVKP